MGCEPFPSRTSRLGASLFQGVRLRSRLTAIRVVAPATTEATIIVVRWRQSPPMRSIETETPKRLAPKRKPVPTVHRDGWLGAAFSGSGTIIAKNFCAAVK